MIIFEGFFLGLTTSTSCIMSCYPLILPLLTSRIKSLKENNIKFLFFTIGRFLSYICIGILLGILGYYTLKYIPVEFQVALKRVSWFLAGILLILNGINLEFPKTKFCSKTIFLTNNKISSFCLGFLAGLNLCPPFLAASSRVFGLNSSDPIDAMLWGGFYFIFFFLGTSISLLPLLSVGFFNKIRNKNFLNVFQFISRWTMIILGFYFAFLEGILYFLSR